MSRRSKRASSGKIEIKAIPEGEPAGDKVYRWLGDHPKTRRVVYTVIPMLAAVGASAIAIMILAGAINDNTSFRKAAVSAHAETEAKLSAQEKVAAQYGEAMTAVVLRLENKIDSTTRANEARYDLVNSQAQYIAGQLDVLVKQNERTIQMLLDSQSKAANNRKEPQ